MDLLKVPTLRKELEFITTNRKAWNQETWLQASKISECGTVGCLAGNAISHSSIFKVPILVDENIALPIRISTGKPIMSWEDAGAEVLGLSRHEASRMFGPYNSLYRLWWLANLYSNGEIDIPLDIERIEEDEY